MQKPAKSPITSQHPAGMLSQEAPAAEPHTGEEQLLTSLNDLVPSPEYRLIIDLTMQQFAESEQPLFERLLSIPPGERLPALVNRYGPKRIHKLITLLLVDYLTAVTNTPAINFTRTRVAVAACELMMAAAEDQLGLEDLIVFFTLARKGRFGQTAEPLTHPGILQNLDRYRAERWKAYVLLSEPDGMDPEPLSPFSRTSPEPATLSSLMERPEIHLPLKAS
ncbi:MAG: hypothetical protein ACXVMS_05970 [Flavisolibacter sp.]